MDFFYNNCENFIEKLIEKFKLNITEECDDKLNKEVLKCIQCCIEIIGNLMKY